MQPSSPWPHVQPGQAGVLADPLNDPLPVVRPGWPCSACGTPNDFGLDACAACGAGFLAALRDEAPALTVPGIGDLGRLSRGRRLALAAGIVLAVLVLTVILGLL